MEPSDTIEQTESAVQLPEPAVQRPEPAAQQQEPEPPAQPQEPAKRVKNQKRVDAGRKLQEHNKRAKKKMLEDIAEANAKASKADANANEAMTALKGYLDQRSTTQLQEYQTPIIISGALLLAGLYLWTTRGTKQSAPAPTNVNTVHQPTAKRDVQGQQDNDDIYTI